MLFYFSLLILVLCIVMFTYNSKVNRAILYLLGFLIPISLYGILHHLFLFNESAYKLAIINVQFLPIYYLTGPMLYFYVRSTINDSNDLSKKDIVHFIPFILGLISVLPFIFKPFDYKLEIAQQFLSNPNSIKSSDAYWIYPNSINVIARPILLIGYSIASLILIRNYSNIKANQSPAVQKELITKWLISISILSTLIALLYIFMTYIFFRIEITNKNSFNNLPIVTFTGFAYAIIPILIFIFPGILYGIPKAKEIESDSQINLEKKLELKSIANKDLIDPLAETSARIMNYIEQNKPYLNTKFSIDDIVEELNIPRHHVGYCFNNIIQSKFTTIRTNYRVAHAKRLLISSQVDIMTMEGIGLESGFASKSSFFSVFKEATGLSPFDFMKQHKNQGTYRKYPKNHSEGFNKPGNISKI